MNICMVVCNNLTRDNRVIREAQTLQAAGHKVSVVGIVASDSDCPVEVMPDGVRLFRVDWSPTARQKLRLRTITWIAFLLLIMGIAIWSGFHFAAPQVDALSTFPGNAARGINWLSHTPLQEKILLAFACALLVGTFAISGLVLSARARDAELARSAMLHNADAISDRDGSSAVKFPAPRSWIPQWAPPALIDVLAVPMSLLGGRFAQFALLQERARRLAQRCIEQEPDIIHAHDCTALPAAALVKKALGIPVVYDAHEIYAEAATRRSGVVDYYILLHRQYLPIVDRFITVNQSIAQYYRHVHPNLSPAVVIRNAATRMPDCVYDGRLHEAAGLPRSEKILLYQGGFTARRGLQNLMRWAGRLPEGWTLVMMGWGPLENELREIALAEHSGRGDDAEGTRVPQKVVFIPGAPREEVLLWTAGASVGIIPYEGDVLNHWLCTPNKLWEFPGAGVPLIVQPFPELRKVIEKYGCGWVLPEVCAPDTLANMIRGLTDEQFREARSGCHKFIEEDSWEAAYVGPLTELYDSLSAAAEPTIAHAPANAPQNESGSVRMENSNMAVHR
jgi:glycosyltransferase involved in cell wall biosynthesis